MRGKWLLGLALLLIACNAQNTPDILGNWVCIKLQGADKDFNVPPHEVFVYFESGNLSGNAGCNQFFAQYHLQGERLSISASGISRMLCDEQAMEREARFMELFSQGESEISIRGHELIIQKGLTYAVFIKG